MQEEKYCIICCEKLDPKLIERDNVQSQCLDLLKTQKNIIEKYHRET
jgi:hypothetical protein